MICFSSRSILWSTCVAATLLAEAALAQSESTAPAARPTDEVLVTARRREENLQQVPIAITALSAADIEEKHITQANDLQKFAPSLRQFFGSMNRNSDQLQLRSLPGVLTYFSEAPASVLGPGRFFDMANVQVLKGPQGTLFGGTSTGGAILFQPRKPGDTPGGYLRGALGNYDLREIEGALDLPLIEDRLLARFAVNQRQRDGYTKDVGPFFYGRRYDDQDHLNLRLGLTLRAGDRFENYLVLDSYRRSTNGTGIKMLDFNPAGPALAVFGNALRAAVAQQQAMGPRHTALSTDQRDRVREWGATDIAEWDIAPDLKLRNIASYRRTQILARGEFEGSPLPILDTVSTGWTSAVRAWSEELQLQGSLFDDSLTWTTGVYMEDNRPIGTPKSVQITFGAAPATNASVNYSKQRALYAQGTYDVGAAVDALSGLRFTAGARKSWDEQKSVRNQYGATGACSGLPGRFFPDCEIELEAKEDAVTWTLGVDYQLRPDLLLYAATRKGYRPGSFNFFAPRADLARVDPEYVKDVEIGIKSEWDIGAARLRTNLAYYYAKYTDIQRTVGFYDPVTNLQGAYTQNAAEATAQGVEFEGTLSLGNFDLTATYAWSDAEYDEFFSATATGLVDLSDTPFPSSPKDKYSISARFTQPLAGGLGDAVVSATWSWQSSYWGLAPDRQPYAEQPSYGLLDIRLGWNGIAGAPVDAALFVTNASNRTYIASAGGVWDALGYVPGIYGEPRMFGMELTYRFGADAR